ncbi:reverse transcriptase domain-containing protein [Tanacetum coccineum]
MPCFVSPQLITLISSEICNMSSSMSAADNPKALFLNELELGITGTIVVMIWMMWDVHAATGRYLSTDFIVSDTKGNVMHCTTKGSIDHNFLRLKEGFVYLVKNFTIVPNKDEFRVIRFADFMLEFDGKITVQKAFLKYDGFTCYPFQLVEIDELEPINNKYLIGKGGFGDMLIEKRTRHVGLYPVVITAMSVKLYNNRLYLSNTSSTLIVDDAKIPLLMRLKTDDSGVALTKEILPMDNTTPKVGTLKNLLMWARNRKYDVTIDKVRTKKGWNYPWCDSCNNSVDYPVIRYRLELEISNETAEVVVVMFDEMARVLLKCSTSSILDCEGQDEEASLGLPPDLANIMGEDVEEGASSATTAANDASKASELKRLNKAPAIATPSKLGEEKKRRRSSSTYLLLSIEELEDSDAEASFVADSQSKGGDVACSSDTRKRKRVVLDDLE